MGTKCAAVLLGGTCICVRYAPNPLPLRWPLYMGQDGMPWALVLPQSDRKTSHPSLHHPLRLYVLFVIPPTLLEALLHSFYLLSYCKLPLAFPSNSTFPSSHAVRHSLHFQYRTTISLTSSVVYQSPTLPSIENILYLSNLR